MNACKFKDIKLVCVQFQDRSMVYRLGSAFYGLYFLVSFPVFLRLDEHLSWDSPAACPPYSLFKVRVFVRVFLSVLLFEWFGWVRSAQRLWAAACWCSYCWTSVACYAG